MGGVGKGFMGGFGKGFMGGVGKGFNGCVGKEVQHSHLDPGTLSEPLRPSLCNRYHIYNHVHRMLFPLSPERTINPS